MVEKQMLETQVREVALGQHTISYTLIRKEVKNINLRVRRDRSVVVSAGRHVPAAAIDDFVRSKIPFLLQAFEKMKQQDSQAVDPMQFLTGEQVPCLGRRLLLQVEQADSRKLPGWLEQAQKGVITYFSRNQRGEALFCRDGRLYFYTLTPDDFVHKQQLYESWQKIQAGILCGQLSRQYYPPFQEMGVAYPTIKIRKMNSRWGSCTPQKQKITFNSLLFEQPTDGVVYVVVHEFAHFIHPNHSKAFYELVGQVLPDWRRRKACLQ